MTFDAAGCGPVGIQFVGAVHGDEVRDVAAGESFYVQGEPVGVFVVEAAARYKSHRFRQRRRWNQIALVDHSS